MYLIAGLGNPGKEYAGTRHNVGFEAANYLADELGISVNKLKHQAIIGEGRMGGERILIAEPQTYMNRSGESIRDIAEYYKIEPAHIIVLYDDMALSAGSIRIRKSGSDGGHNGIKSIIYQLRSDQFPRVRFGVGAPREKGEGVIRHVLGKFSKNDFQAVGDAVHLVEPIVRTMIEDSVEAAMNQFNRTIKSEEL